MTTTVSEKDRNAAFEAGMDAFTEKPIFVDRFYASLSLYLNRKDEK
jgi:CheY-like chemotaxis protein